MQHSTCCLSGQRAALPAKVAAGSTCKGMQAHATCLGSQSPAMSQHIKQDGLAAMQYARCCTERYDVQGGSGYAVCRLMRKEKGIAVLVPDEAPPLDRHGKPAWPPGWSTDRKVLHERDIFELCGIPYKPPHLRNAP